jgi:peroxiredoxin
LAGFEEHAGAFLENDVRVVALSADPEEGAERMVEKEELSFPVLYGLDVDEMRDRLGLYVRKGEKTHLQPAQLIVGPEGTIEFASYSSGKVGRLSAEEALEEVGG